MKHALVVALVLWIGCGPSSGEDPPAKLPDGDGDGISDFDEDSASGRDSDGDGVPDFLDEDSDGDGITDAIEAGDGDLATAPYDSDGDGTADFRDLDSDANDRPDRADGAADTDGDGIGDYADPDDDGDAIFDLEELAGDPLDPPDTDLDDVPDFRDFDSDDDGIDDATETSADYDNDTRGNYVDLDSDGDCTGDAVEARGTPPADSDGDTRPDFLDRDSDDDGVPDRSEDRNCNGVVDAGESNPHDSDSDDDGAPDMVETAAGTDPTDASDNPQANGDFVFIEPYQAPQTPTAQDLDFSTQLQAVDLYVMLDRSQSMSAEIGNVKANLASVVAGLRCTPGQTTGCIPDLWAGAATVGYRGGGASAFVHYADIGPSLDLGALPITEPGGCCAEPLTYAAFAAVTALGGAAYNVPVLGRNTCLGSPAANAGYTTSGYPCFRGGALPVVMMATDEAPLSGGQVHTSPGWDAIVRPAFATAKARLVGIIGSDYEPATLTDLQKLARDTGAIDAANANAPLVFDGAGANAATAIRDGILALANGLPLDLAALAVDDPGDAVDTRAAFIARVEVLQSGTAQCTAGLTAVDSDGDSYADRFVQVRTGTPVCWKLVSKVNATVPPTDAPQLFRATVRVSGDGVTLLDQRDVYFLVPPRPADGPIL